MESFKERFWSGVIGFLWRVDAAIKYCQGHRKITSPEDLSKRIRDYN